MYIYVGSGSLISIQFWTAYMYHYFHSCPFSRPLLLSVTCPTYTAPSLPCTVQVWKRPLLSPQMAKRYNDLSEPSCQGINATEPTVS